MRETTPQTRRSVSKEREEVLQVPEQILLQPLAQSMVRAAVLMQPIEVHGGGNIWGEVFSQPGERAERGYYQ